MRILITNDDGITAEGLEVLARIAADLAGPSGEVVTVAPAFEQSGVGHCISYTHPMMITKLGPKRYAVEGSPADCVLVGVYEVMGGKKPDLILSGVNRGNNAGENVLYSGTVGAAIEGALHGIPAIALSQYMGPKTDKLADPFAAAASHGLAVVRRLLDHGTWDGADYRMFYNVNFPPVAAGDVKGHRVCPMGFRRDVAFGVQAQTSPSGRKFLWVKGGGQQTPTLPGTDVAELLDGYISITPLRADMTDHASLDALARALA
ncbi:MAG: 5'/3'-nucleotidase SurE [Cypionkella sp.]|nr:5'/3'-nucleotidase SurE [Cypionkella sp.]